MKSSTVAVIFLNIVTPGLTLAQESLPTFRTITLGVELTEFRNFNRFPLAQGQRWLCSDEKAYARSSGRTPDEQERHKYGTVICTVVRQSSLGYSVQDRVPVPGLMTPATIELTFYRAENGLPRLLGEIKLATSPGEADKAEQLFSARYGSPETDLHSQFPFPRHVWRPAGAEIRIAQNKVYPMQLFITYEMQKYKNLRVKDYMDQKIRDAKEL